MRARYMASCRAWEILALRFADRRSWRETPRTEQTASWIASTLGEALTVVAPGCEGAWEPSGSDGASARCAKAVVTGSPSMDENAATRVMAPWRPRTLPKHAAGDLIKRCGVAQLEGAFEGHPPQERRAGVKVGAA